MVDIEQAVKVEWITDLTEGEIRAERAIFARIYPDFIRDVTARFDRFEQLALALGSDGTVMSCAGSRRRHIAVGDSEMVISGVGGVMTNPDARLHGAARRTLTALASTFRRGGRCESDFGFLQCRSEIVPFYERVGWTRVHNLVRHIDQHDGESPVTSSSPTMIVPGRRTVDEWPAGLVHLRGLPW